VLIALPMPTLILPLRSQAAQRSVSAPRLDALTSTRFIAAFFVMVFHVSASTPMLRLAPKWLQNVITGGYVWVGFFFVLSGFILTYQYAEKFRSGTVAVRDFWFARFARIYPGHLVGFALWVALIPCFPGVSYFPTANSDAVNATTTGLVVMLQQAWVPPFALALNFPSWSLSVEAFFYLLFPVLATAAARQSLKQVLGWAVLALGLETVASLLYCSLAPEGWLGNTIDPETTAINFIKFSPVIRLGEFVFGVLLGRVYLARDQLPFTEAAGARLAIAGACVVALGLVFSSTVPFALMHNVALVLPFGAMILGLALDPQSLPARSLGGAMLVRLGDASYSLYILHGSFVLLLYTSKWWDRVGLSEAIAARIVVIIAAIAAALLSHRFVETPMRRWLRVRFAHAPHLPVPAQVFRM
jgi:peptidoglycan/LPS O-acetylase OafA/YrhL